MLFEEIFKKKKDPQESDEEENDSREGGHNLKEMLEPLFVQLAFLEQ